MKPVTAGEVMIPLEEYPHIPYWFTIRQALMELEKGVVRLEGDRCSIPRVVLVFNESYQLLGMVRRRDLLKGLELETLGGWTGGAARLFRRRAPASRELDDATLARLAERAERQVSEILTPVPATVEAGDTVLHVARVLVEQDISLLPVVEEGGVVGVVRTVEVLREITRLVVGR